MFRNREFRRFIIVFLLISFVLTVIGFFQSSSTGVLVLGSALIFGVLFLLFTQSRYKQIAEMADQIDLVLHNEDHLFIEELDEGELSILQSEITKMTLRIREQNRNLKKEKEHLADSLADIATNCVRH